MLLCDFFCGQNVNSVYKIHEEIQGIFRTEGEKRYERIGNKNRAGKNLFPEQRDHDGSVTERKMQDSLSGYCLGVCENG